MAVTMKDIANDLGVSVVTVSKAMRNHNDISLKTRTRVLQRIKELDYRPNLAARSLATGKSYLMGLVVPDLVHPFFSLVAKGASRVLRKKGYSLIIASSEEDPDLEIQELSQMMARNLDVYIVASAQTGPESLCRFVEQKKSLILVDRRFSSFPAHYVGTDDKEIGRMATDHLIERGCRQIACIGGRDVSPAMDRLEGYKHALTSHGLPVLEQFIVTRVNGDNHGDVTGFEAMNSLLRLNPRPDGVFCLNDPTAMGAMKAITEGGLRIPQDIAVIGCGNVPYASELRVPLTSVDQDCEMIGENAAKLAFSLVEGKQSMASPKTILMKPKLIPRNSTNRFPQK